MVDNFYIRMVTKLCFVALLLISASSLHAQQQAPPVVQDSTPPKVPPQTVAAAHPAISPQTVHRFWDRDNDLLFAAVGAGRAFDYASTLDMRRRGVDEIFLTNQVVDNHPLFAGIEVAATAASMGASYLFHRTGHHRLERWTSAVHFGVATGGAIRNYGLKGPNSK